MSAKTDAERDRVIRAQFDAAAARAAAGPPKRKPGRPATGIGQRQRQPLVHPTHAEQGL